MNFRDYTVSSENPVFLKEEPPYKSQREMGRSSAEKLLAEKLTLERKLRELKNSGVKI